MNFFYKHSPMTWYLGGIVVGWVNSAIWYKYGHIPPNKPYSHVQKYSIAEKYK